MKFIGWLVLPLFIAPISFAGDREEKIETYLRRIESKSARLLSISEDISRGFYDKRSDSRVRGFEINEQHVKTLFKDSHAGDFMKNVLTDSKDDARRRAKLNDGKVDWYSVDKLVRMQFARYAMHASILRKMMTGDVQNEQPAERPNVREEAFIPQQNGGMINPGGPPASGNGQIFIPGTSSGGSSSGGGYVDPGRFRVGGGARPAQPVQPQPRREVQDNNTVEKQLTRMIHSSLNAQMAARFMVTAHRYTFIVPSKRSDSLAKGEQLALVAQLQLAIDVSNELHEAMYNLTGLLKNKYDMADSARSLLKDFGPMKTKAGAQSAVRAEPYPFYEFPKESEDGTQLERIDYQNYLTGDVSYPSEKSPFEDADDLSPDDFNKKWKKNDRDGKKPADEKADDKEEGEETKQPSSGESRRLGSRPGERPRR